MRWGEDFFVVCALAAITIFLIVNLMKLAYAVRENCRKERDIGTARPGTVYTITSDTRLGNNTTTASTDNFPDYLWDISSSNTRINEPAKDDKDLPSYEEVIRMEMASQVTNAVPVTNCPASNTVQTSPQSVRLPV